LGATRADHAQAVARERALQHPAQRRFVVDHEDGARCGAHEAEARASSGVRKRWTTRANASFESRAGRISPAVRPRDARACSVRVWACWQPRRTATTAV